MTPEFTDLILGHLFGAGASPKTAGSYYVRLCTTDGTEVQVADWTDYAPQAVDPATEFTAPGAGTGGRRETTVDIEVSFSAAAVITGSDVVIKYVVVSTTNDDLGEVVAIVTLSPTRSVANGDVVKIPVNRLALFGTPSSPAAATVTLNA